MIEKKNITGIILAGGKSSRMGRDKGLIRFNGKPFIEHIIAALTPVVSKIIIVSSNSEYDDFGSQRIEDSIPNAGPLAGLHSGLSHSSTSYNLVLSCDVPNIKTEALNYLLSRASTEHQVNEFESDGNSIPLVAIYKKECVGYFNTLLAEDERRLRFAVSQLKSKSIPAPTNLKAQLKNINTRSQLQKLQDAVNH